MISFFDEVSPTKGFPSPLPPMSLRELNVLANQGYIYMTYEQFPDGNGDILVFGRKIGKKTDFTTRCFNRSRQIISGPTSNFSFDIEYFLQKSFYRLTWYQFANGIDLNSTRFVFFGREKMEWFRLLKRAGISYGEITRYVWPQSQFSTHEKKQPCGFRIVSREHFPELKPNHGFGESMIDLGYRPLDHQDVLAIRAQYSNRELGGGTILCYTAIWRDFEGDTWLPYLSSEGGIELAYLRTMKPFEFDSVVVGVPFKR